MAEESGEVWECVFVAGRRSVKEREKVALAVTI
jgi:hypothetical protein